MGKGDTLLNAVIGAVVTVVLSFTAISPLLGGAVAGYLQRGSGADGARIGAIAGAVAALPFLALFALVFGVFLSVGVFSGGEGLPLVGGIGVATLLVVVFALAWSVGLSAAGGYVGAVIADDRGDSGPSRTQSPP